MVEPILSSDTASEKPRHSFSANDKGFMALIALAMLILAGVLLWVGLSPRPPSGYEVVCADLQDRTTSLEEALDYMLHLDKFMQHCAPKKSDPKQVNLSDFAIASIQLEPPPSPLEMFLASVGAAS